MVEFLKNAMDWVINKEDELAKNCAVKPEDVDKQIKVIEEKRAELRKKFEEEDAEFAHVLSKLTLVKADAIKCTTKK